VLFARARAYFAIEIKGLNIYREKVEDHGNHGNHGITNGTARMIPCSKPAVQCPPFMVRRSKACVHDLALYAVRFDSIRRRWIRLAPIESRPFGPAVAVAVAVDAVEVPGCRRGRGCP
jgi:hypothetical protein